MCQFYWSLALPRVSFTMMETSQKEVLELLDCLITESIVRSVKPIWHLSNRLVDPKHTVSTGVSLLEYVNDIFFLELVSVPTLYVLKRTLDGTKSSYLSCKLLHSPLLRSLSRVDGYLGR